ncbi:MAG: DUF1622 domain-containing protein [Chloroflexales bacterium]|nr:DUF1622 domain-containing protein [Chloroflexales bacterium]
MGEHQTAGIVAALLEWIEVAALSLELLAVGIIIIVALVSTALFARRFLAEGRPPEAYESYKVQLGRGLLLGLEMLVAADVVRTVALEPTLSSVAVLGILVLIRTFLSWSLTLEIEHRWPWQRPLERQGAPDAHRDGL